MLALSVATLAPLPALSQSGPYVSPQLTELQRLQSASTRALHVDFRGGLPRFVKLSVPATGANAHQRALNFLAESSDLFLQTPPDLPPLSPGALPRPEIAYVQEGRIATDAIEETQVLRFGQTYGGLPVFGARMTVSVHEPIAGPAEIIQANGALMPAPLTPLDVVPAIDEVIATATARTHAAAPGAPVLGEPELAVFSPEVIDEGGEARLAWIVRLGGAAATEILVDAHDQSVLFALPTSVNAYDVDLYLGDANGQNMKDTSCFPWFLGIDDYAGDEDGLSLSYVDDLDATYVRWWTINISDWYYDHLGRRGVDNDDGEVKAWVHAGLDFPNATWGGGCGMQFTDGFASSDIVAHEYTHGINTWEAKLFYRGESGALSESYADTLAELAEPIPDWLFAAGRLDGGGALRSFKYPNGPRNDCGPEGERTVCGHPDHMDDFVDLPADEDNDWGGVHTNSSIINHAHWRLTAGPGGGIGVAKARRLLYRVLLSHDRAATFDDARQLTVGIAESYVDFGWYDFTSDDVCKIREAFAFVGIGSGDFDCDGVENQFDDPDGDFIDSADDNCPLVANPEQRDTNADGQGDLCDNDLDHDGIDDDYDNCPGLYNPGVGQLDYDNDGQGNACDDDDDGDGVDDDVPDNCPGDYNPDQFDGNSNGWGDACDPDYDGDGVYSPDDNCQFVDNPPVSGSQPDADGDGIGDACDLCPDDADNLNAYTTGIPELGVDPAPFQPDTDGDGTPDACDIADFGNVSASIAGENYTPAQPLTVSSDVAAQISSLTSDIGRAELPLDICVDAAGSQLAVDERIEIVLGGLDNAVSVSITDSAGNIVVSFLPDDGNPDSPIRGAQFRPDCSVDYTLVVDLPAPTSVPSTEDFDIAIAIITAPAENPWTRDITQGIFEPAIEDADGDGLIDLVDLCPDDFDPSNRDLDNNSVGDVCEHTSPYVFSIDVLADELVLIDSNSGAVGTVGPLDFDAIVVDMGTLYDRLFAINSIFDVGVFLYELDPLTGQTVFTTEVSVDGASIGLAEGLAQVGGQLKISYRDDATAPFAARSNVMADLDLQGRITNVEFAPNSSSANGLDLDALGDNDFHHLHATDSVLFARPLDTQFLTVNPSPLDTTVLHVDTSNPVLNINDIIVDYDRMVGIVSDELVEFDLATNSVVEPKLALAQPGTYFGAARVPVPEPGTTGMLGIACVAMSLAWTMRRRAARRPARAGPDA